MNPVSLPILAISEKATFDELPTLFAETVKGLGARKISNALLLFEVCVAPEWAHGQLKPSANPTRMIVMTYNVVVRDAVAKALSAVGARETPRPLARATLKVKGNTPLNNLFKQLEEVPLTMFSMTNQKNPASTLFFVRTPETIAEFKRELAQIPLG